MKRRVAQLMGAWLSLLILVTMSLPVPQPVTARGQVGSVVDLVLLPATTNVTVGSNFTVTIQARCNDQDVAGIQAFINFDLTKLRVVDADDNVTNGIQIAPGTTLPTVLLNSCNNTAGTIDYSAGLLGGPGVVFPSGNFIVATITFIALAPVHNTSLTFHSVDLRKTDAVYAGDSKLRSATGASVMIPQAPTVTTDNATSISATYATLKGTLVAKGTADNVTVSFECWGVTTNYTASTPPVSTSTIGPFSAVLTGLSPVTTYRYRAKAVGDGTSYGDNVTFTTIAAQPPTVTTDNATNLTANSAILHGTLNNKGTAATVQVSFEWGLSAGSYTGSSPPISMSTTGPFTATATNLSASTTYHFRAKAVGDEIGYGADNIFRTPPPPPLPGPTNAQRVLPAATTKSQSFDVRVTFSAPADGFSSLYISDFAPTGWTVTTNLTWCTPAADQSTATNNGVVYMWYSAPAGYPSGTPFTAVYRVTVPAGATPGTYIFTGGYLEYYNGVGAGPFIDNISGNYLVEVVEGARVSGVTYEVKGVILPGVTLTLDGTISVVSDSNGNYLLIVPTVGTHTVVASKAGVPISAGFRNYTRTVNVTDLTATYTLDFKANYGLVPNAPGPSYVLACINKWKFPPEGLGLSPSKVLSVINAWKFPIT